MNRERKPGQRERGAILLLMVAILGMGAAAVLINLYSRTSIEARRVQRTLTTLAEARDALIGFAVANGRLPRPAASATDGREAAAACVEAQDCSGFIPWVTLGVDGSDAWGKRLRYSVTPVMTQAPVRRLAAVSSKTVLYRDSWGTLRYRVGFDNCTRQTPCAPAVLYSTGRHNFGTSVDGVAQLNTASGNLDEAANALGGDRYIQRPASDDPRQPGGVYDDLVIWLPQPLLFNRMLSAQQLP